MEELEDGEVLDSDSEDKVVNTSSKNGCTDRNKVPVPDIVKSVNDSLVSRYAAVHSYRTAKPQTTGSDESDASSDEDSDLWNCKRAKYLSSQRAQDFCSERNNPSYSKTEHFIHSPRKKEFASFSKSSSSTSHKKRAGNNIWGAVIQEQTLTQDIHGFGVDKDEELNCDRNVESYDYTKSHIDSRPHLEPDLVAVGSSANDDPFGGVVDLEPNEGAQGLKRKRPARNRVGKRTFDKDKCRDHIGVTSEDSVPQIVNAMVKQLNEPKVELITRVVETLGKKKSLELLYLTEDIEESGGMYVMNGERRRTPGGVFFQLLKMDMDVTKAHIKHIFAEEEKLKTKGYREARRRKLQEKSSKENRNDMEEDDDSRKPDTTLLDTNTSIDCDVSTLDSMKDDSITLEIAPEDEITLS
ncbi:hypothetical protein LOTGIDRAFT_235308 [Lottia gigantea]|uniref:Phosphorylated adapter RNA export protein n=1 Tax=Lottia gigantea TaxID=225164 RepID=V3ZVT3_LOTGI|nr:hypothetical protein LOTGIDRAFT_235308 [Lottia gigantea]ESO86720.1 hypothetical protein LOTGIDRAFT_235308 [Lottia gigantea]